MDPHITTNPDGDKFKNRILNLSQSFGNHHLVGFCNICAFEPSLSFFFAGIVDIEK